MVRHWSPTGGWQREPGDDSEAALRARARVEWAAEECRRAPPRVARAGARVLGGLDPNFTVNAWGGPTYLGAMTCHYLDCALICAASAWLASRILLR